MITVISLRNLRYFWRKVKSYFVGNYYNKTVMNLKIQEILEDTNNKLARANSFTTLKVAEERQRAISDLQAVVTDIESSFENVDAAIAAERERIGQAEGDITIMKSNWDNINATIDTEVITQLQTTGSQITNAVGILIDGRVPSITATVLQEVEEELDNAISRNQTITQLVLDVSGISGRVGTLETTATGLNTRVGALELSSSGFSTRISAMEGVLTDGGTLINVKTKFSAIEQNVDSISQIVSNGDNYAAIVTRINESTGEGEVIIDAEHIELRGTAIADALITNKLTALHIDASTLSIGAAQITSGTISADRIDVNSLITAQLIVDKLEAAQATIDDLTLTHAHFSSDNSVDAYLNIENGQILLGTSNVFSNSRILIKQNNIELYLSNTSRKYNTKLDRQYIYLDNWDEYGNNGRITVLPDRIGFSSHNTVFEKTSRITDTGIKGYISFDNNHNLKINENYSIQSDAVNKVWKGTLVEYNAISAKDDNTLYLITS